MTPRRRSFWGPSVFAASLLCAVPGLAQSEETANALPEVETPAADAEQETDLRAISAMIKPVPTWFTDEDAYVYDNISDAWLIVVPLEAPNPC